MEQYIIIVALISSLTAFLLHVAKQWGIIEFLQLHAPCKLVWEMLDCDFCKSFWLGVALSVVASVVFADWWLMLVPMFSAKLSQKLLE